MQYRWFSEDHHTAYYTAPGEPNKEYGEILPDNVRAHAWPAPYALDNGFDLHLVSLGSHIHMVMLDSRSTTQTKPRHVVVRAPTEVLPTVAVRDSIADGNCVGLELVALCEHRIVLTLHLSVERIPDSEVPHVKLEVQRHNIASKEIGHLSSVSRSNGAILLHGEERVVELFLSGRDHKESTVYDSSKSGGISSWFSRSSATSDSRPLSSTLVSAGNQEFLAVLYEGSMLRLHNYPNPRLDTVVAELSIPANWDHTPLRTCPVGDMSAIVFCATQGTHFISVEISGSDKLQLTSVCVIPELASNTASRGAVAAVCGGVNAYVTLREVHSDCDLPRSPLMVLSPTASASHLFSLTSQVVSGTPGVVQRISVFSTESGEQPVAVGCATTGSPIVWAWDVTSGRLAAYMISSEHLTSLDRVSRTLAPVPCPVNLTPVQPISTIPPSQCVFVPTMCGLGATSGIPADVRTLISAMTCATLTSWDFSAMRIDVTDGLNAVVRRSLYAVLDAAPIIEEVLDIGAALGWWRRAIKEAVDVPSLHAQSLDTLAAVESATCSVIALRMCHAALYCVTLRCLRELDIATISQEEIVAADHALRWYMGVHDVLVTVGYVSTMSQRSASVADFADVLNGCLIPHSPLSMPISVAKLFTRTMQNGVMQPVDRKALAAWLRAWGTNHPELHHFEALLELQHPPRGHHPHRAVQLFLLSASYISSCPNDEDKITALQDVVDGDARMLEVVEQDPSLACEMYLHLIAPLFTRPGNNHEMTLTVPAAALAPYIHRVLHKSEDEIPRTSLLARVWMAYVNQCIEDGNLTVAHNHIVAKPKGVVSDSSVMSSLMRTFARSCLSTSEGTALLQHCVLGADPLHTCARRMGNNGIDSELLFAVCTELYSMSRRRATACQHTTRGSGSSGVSQFEESVRLLVDILIVNGHFGLAARIAFDTSEVLRRTSQLQPALSFLELTAQALESIPKTVVESDDTNEEDNDFDSFLTSGSAGFSAANSSYFSEIGFGDLVPYPRSFLPTVKRTFLHLRAIMVVSPSLSSSSASNDMYPAVWETETEEEESLHRVVDALIQSRAWSICANLLRAYQQSLDHLVASCAAVCYTSTPVQWESLFEFLAEQADIEILVGGGSRISKQKLCLCTAKAARHYDVALQQLLTVDPEIDLPNEIVSAFINLDARAAVSSLLARTLSDSVPSSKNVSCLQGIHRAVRGHLRVMGPALLDAVVELSKRRADVCPELSGLVPMIEASYRE